MSDKKIININTVGFSGLLTIVFVALKLTGYINWRWIWVLSPLWISFVFSLILLAFVLGLETLTYYDHKRNKR